MKVEFSKTGAKRYAVKILHDDAPVYEMNPAPGFDNLMPHDLCHFIVEQVLHIENAIFGQAAKGSGTFRNLPSETSNDKNDSRQRRKAKQKAKKSVKQNSEDYAKSERATYICWQNWLSESVDPESKCRAAEMQQNVDSIYNQMPAAERAIYTKENLAKVRLKMDELSRRWKSVEVGESMIVDWKS